MTDVTDVSQKTKIFFAEKITGITKVTSVKTFFSPITLIHIKKLPLQSFSFLDSENSHF